MSVIDLRGNPVDDSAKNIVKIIEAAANAKKSQLDLEKTLMLDDIQRQRDRQDKQYESQNEMNQWQGMFDPPGVATSATPGEVVTPNNPWAGMRPQVGAGNTGTAKGIQSGFQSAMPPTQGALTASTNEQQVTSLPEIDGFQLPNPQTIVAAKRGKGIDFKDITYANIYKKMAAGTASEGERTWAKDYLGIKQDEKDRKRSKDYFDMSNKLRDDFDKLSKDYRLVRDSYGRIQASSQDPSAAGDLALIFNYMKMLDPGSTVREGEFATAQNSASIPDRIVGMYNKVRKGERLAPGQREDFVARANKLYESQASIQKKNIDLYSKRSEKAGVDPADVITDLDDFNANPETKDFATEEEAEAANLPSGTIIMINGRKAQVN